MGLDGRSFKLYKFRSMRIDAETNGQGKWTRTDDPRVTRIGGISAPLQPRRTAPADQRPQGRHVPGRAAAGAARVRRSIQAPLPRVPGPPPGARRAHRLGPGQRPPRRHLHPTTRGPRSLLHRELEPRAGSQDPVEDLPYRRPRRSGLVGATPPPIGGSLLLEKGCHTPDALRMEPVRRVDLGGEGEGVAPVHPGGSR